jgi:hypothetical protein
MTRLKLVEAAPPPPDAFEIPAVDLRKQPTRPGVTQTELKLQVSRRLAMAVGDLARSEGLREDAWIGLVVESERAVRLAAATDVDAAHVRQQLDAQAAYRAMPVPGGPVRLAKFADALRQLAGGHNSRISILATADKEEITLKASLPYQSIAAWRRSAIESGQSLDAWAAERLEKLPKGRHLWEAAAVERGEGLAEWVLTQAARRSADR